MGSSGSMGAPRRREGREALERESDSLPLSLTLCVSFQPHYDRVHVAGLSGSPR